MISDRVAGEATGVSRNYPVTGLLGGSFNPAHQAHRRISLFAASALSLDEVWWLVSPGNPLKPKAGMASLAARFRSAQAMARRAPIKVTAIERQLGTRYTVDTLRAIKARYPRRRFVWLMGADNLAQFHLWKDWRQIAREMPIAVIARPGYDDAALASPAMAWLRRYRLSAAGLQNRGEWSAPALIELRFDPDPRSATAIRRADPDWASHFTGPPPRDGVTHSIVRDPAIHGLARGSGA
ncbi:putative nicotinate-nucleotide adenylyltransferase [Croceibacterium atlanticum]|uniref:Probable nicotinate-nucleotide adenylyltransferase n=1 Tax=Croceibacterium atlanticum TaxID=1267766 RepID=A0A0F7KW14_9SPHN|nr:nicotinate-nucleotide adenylyltransferase [Croceibacterium atlanticum]AKH43372.1 putative nicotinate-nucleotide adenylyltransferase [Croceibacterium atlanticum]